MACSIWSSFSSSPWMVLSSLILLSYWTLPAKGVELTLFYPFGPQENDVVMKPGDETSSDEIHLQEIFLLYNQTFKSAYVNTNGHISFESEVPAYRAHIAMPLGTYIVAAFFADIDTRGSGKIYYRNTSDAAVLERAAADVQIHFSGFGDFIPKSLFIVTWDRVGYFEEKSDKVNTFQIVLATDGVNTFAFFHYLDNGIQWKQSDGKFVPSYPDIPPQAGFEGGKDGTYFLLEGSGVTGDFVMKSNINVPGVWMYHIGYLDSGNVADADLVTRDEQIFVPENEVEQCLQATGVCSPNAECIQHETGFCCACVPPYYGNGYDCLEQERAQTVNGRVHGVVNDFPLDDNHFMHTYVETKDGRVHSSISRIPEALAPGMQTLNSVGGIAGWIFALRTGSNAKNGFEYTGGRFNRSARVTFQSENRTDLVLRVYQSFQGFAAPNNIRVDTRMDGYMPDIPSDADVDIEDFTEVYEKTGRGVIRSFAQRIYRVNGAPYRYTWENTIMFEECDDGMPQEARDRMTLEVSRIYFNYDATHKAYRYGMWSRILETRDDDPCRSDVHNCDRNADCDREGDSFRCSCRAGFTGDGVTCEDVNECLRSPCDVNANCINTPGRFQCLCLPGYSGNGRTCQRDVQLCGSSICDDNARCVFVDDLSQPVCQCNTGFRGNGERCTAIEYNCREADICGDNAQCVYDDILREYACECLDDFSGDGYSCERIDQGCDACHPYALCVLDPFRNRNTCQCREGFTGDGRTCTTIDTCARCDRYARCVFYEDISSYRCVCVRGYEGDGQTCSRVDCREREGLCAEEGGLCWLDPNTNMGICRCNYGYRGDGFRCDKLSCDVYNFCDRNAQCIARGEEYICQCDDGFEGDGRRCRPSGPTTCDVYNDCDRNARCLPDRVNRGTYSCQCNPGFQGDGKRCDQVERGSCNEVNFCDRNARCLPDRSNPDTYSCQCNPGFEGDGERCRQTDRGPCNEVCDRNARCLPERSNPGTYSCQCNPGFEGDGERCRQIERGSCNEVNFCDRNARCLPDRVNNGTYSCQCNPGFEGDGERCRQTERGSCNDVNFCDRNARCLPDRANPGTYSCQCNPGFEGDGERCRQTERVPCNQVDNCDRNAECLYDPDELSYRCVCRRGYEGNGEECRRREVIDCRRNQRMCSPNADCVRGTDEAYICVCRPGFRGDGASCSPVVREGQYLIYAQGNKLMKVSSEARQGDYGEQLVFVPGQLAVGVDIDCNNGYVYWTDAANGHIRRARLNGSDVEIVLSGLKSPEGVAIDFIAGNMFYTDSEMDVLQVAKLDGTEVRTLADVDMFNPRAIVLDINKGTIFWTDWNRHKPQIERMNMDGTERSIFVNNDLRLPNGLTFDSFSQLLCWCDAGSKTIECIRSDGVGRRVIYDKTSHPFDLTILNNAVYWTDWQRRNIPNVNRNGEEANEPLPLAVGGHGRLYGITAVRDQCPRVRNSCALNNGGCSYLCLPSPNGGRTCACPDGVDPRICQQ